MKLKKPPGVRQHLRILPSAGEMVRVKVRKPVWFRGKGEG